MHNSNSSSSGSNTSFKARYVATCHSLGIEPLNAVLGVLESTYAAIATNGAATASKGVVLNLSALRVSPKSAIALAEALREDSVFSEVILSDCILNDEGCCIISEALKSNNSVTSLDLRGNNIKQDGAASLAFLLKVNPKILSLSLEWNSIGLWDLSIKQLADALTVNTSLRELDLRNNRIGSQGGIALALALKANKSLLKLDLRWNTIGVAGGRAFVDMLKYNYSLLLLDLSGNDLPLETTQAIEAAIFRNRDAQQLKDNFEKQSSQLENALKNARAEHDQHMQFLSEQLKTREFEHLREGQTLRAMLGDVNSRLSNIRESHTTVESKLHAEAHAREVAEARVRDLEEALISTRRDAAGLAQRLHTDVTHERDLRAAAEAAQRAVLDERDVRVREAERAADALKRCVDDLQAALEDERRKNVDSEGRMTLLRNENVSLRSKLEQIHTEHAAQLSQQQEKYVKEMEERTHAMEKECESLRKQLSKIRKGKGDELSALMQRLHEEEEARRRAGEDRLSNLQKANEDLQSTCKAQAAELSAVRRELSELHAAAERDRAHALNAEHEVVRLRGDVDAINAEKQHMQHTLELTQRSEQATKAEYQRMMQKHEEHLKGVLQQHRSDMTALQNIIQTRDQEMANLQTKLIQSRIEQQQRLQQLVKELL